MLELTPHLPIRAILTDGTETVGVRRLTPAQMADHNAKLAASEAAAFAWQPDPLIYGHRDCATPGCERRVFHPTEPHCEPCHQAHRRNDEIRREREAKAACPFQPGACVTRKGQPCPVGTVVKLMVDARGRIGCRVQWQHRSGCGTPYHTTSTLQPERLEPAA